MASTKRRTDNLKCLWLPESCMEKQSFVMALGAVFQIKSYVRVDNSIHGYVGYFGVTVERTIPTGRNSDKESLVEEECHICPDGNKMWLYRFKGKLVGYFEPETEI